MQVGFIDVICLPLYRVLCDTFPWITPLYEGTLENRRNWQDLAEKVEMGLTWIDHDTIDKPVEEFAACADEEIKDIEFTVTTLNCNQQSQHGSEDSHTPEHHRSGSRLSMKKTGALGKAVRSKLSSKLYNSMDGSKPKTSLKLLETELSTSTLAQIAQFVATTGQTVNICDVHEWVREHNQIRAEDEIDSTQAILCMPIMNAQKKVIGVAQLINKVHILLILL